MKQSFPQSSCCEHFLEMWNGMIGLPLQKGILFSRLRMGSCFQRKLFLRWDPLTWVTWKRFHPEKIYESSWPFQIPPWKNPFQKSTVPTSTVFHSTWPPWKDPFQKSPVLISTVSHSTVWTAILLSLYRVLSLNYPSTYRLEPPFYSPCIGSHP